MAADDIGCSLAEAAEAKPYETYLAQAQATPRSLHVVSRLQYIIKTRIEFVWGCYTLEVMHDSETTHSHPQVYINTSLRTKAYAHEAVPTITCTSSNVVQTVLQAFAQVCTPCCTVCLQKQSSVSRKSVGSLVSPLGVS
jgi:quinolinate synthase